MEDKSPKQENLGEDLAFQGILGGDAQATLAEQLGMPIFNDFSSLQLSKERFKQVPYNFAKKHTFSLSKIMANRLSSLLLILLI